MRVDRKIHLRQPREMAHHLQLGYLRQGGRRRAAQVRGNLGRAGGARRN